MTPRLQDRKLAIQLEMERQLRGLMAEEAVEVLARIMAHVVNRDPSQFPTLTELFRNAFAAEHQYLAECRHRAAQKRADDERERGIS
jgi:hypothetical protein